MSATAQLLREQVQAKLGTRWSAAFQGQEAKPDRETLRSLAGEIPRGALTEITGPASSGRTSLLYSLLANATSGQEFCALLDAEDRFDPASAAAMGVRLSQVLWVRCRGNAEHALKAGDMLANGGGFGLIAIDLGDVPLPTTRRIPLAAWFRLRHAVEHTRTALVVVSQQIQARSCSALKIEFQPVRAQWQGAHLLHRFEVTGQTNRNHHMQAKRFTIGQ